MSLIEKVLNKLDEWVYLVQRLFSRLFCRHRHLVEDGISIRCANCGKDFG